jgi:quercetin dioxygenase-like cupin family protein
MSRRGNTIVDWVKSMGSSRSEWQALDDTIELHSGILARRMIEHSSLALDVVRLQANRAFVPHRHENLHILIVQSGLGFYYQLGMVAHLKAGAIVEVLPNEIHCLGAGDRALVAAVVSMPRSSLVSEQRGKTISTQEAEELAADVKCIECGKCSYTSQTSDMLTGIGAATQ